MLAVGFEEFGGPDVLHVVELPAPQPGPGEVRIRVRAATVNPTDEGLRSGRNGDRLRQLPLPWVPGTEAAGVIDAVGEGTSWLPGDEVMAIVIPHGPHGGAYAEHVIVPADQVGRIPKGATFVEAATLPMNGLTVCDALRRLSLRPGDTVAVTGSAGAFGGYAVQLAKADGLRVIADAAEADEALVRGLGADVIVRRGGGVAARIREVVPDGVDGLVDVSRQHAEVVPAVRDGGGIAVVRGWKSELPRGVVLHSVQVMEYRPVPPALDRLRQLVEDGAVTLRVAAVFTPEGAAEAHRRMAAGGNRGRLVIEL